MEREFVLAPLLLRRSLTEAFAKPSGDLPLRGECLELGGVGLEAAHGRATSGRLEARAGKLDGRLVTALLRTRELVLETA